MVYVFSDCITWWRDRIVKPYVQSNITEIVIENICDFQVIVRRAGLLDRMVAVIIQVPLEFSFILFDLCLLIIFQFYNELCTYVTFWTWLDMKLLNYLFFSMSNPVALANVLSRSLIWLYLRGYLLDTA